MCFVIFVVVFTHVKNKACSYCICCFLISFIGIYWYPWGDNQTHFVIYYSDIVNKYYSFLLSSSYWLYDYVIYIIARFLDNIYGDIFLVICAILIISACCLEKVNEQDIPHKEKWLLLLLLLMFWVSENT